MPLSLLKDAICGVHCLARQNTSGLDVQDLYHRPFLDFTNGEDVDSSTYNKTDGEVSETDDSDDNTPPSYTCTPGDTEFTDLCNLQLNAG